MEFGCTPPPLELLDTAYMRQPMASKHTVVCAKICLAVPGIGNLALEEEKEGRTEVVFCKMCLILKLLGQAQIISII